MGIDGCIPGSSCESALCPWGYMPIVPIPLAQAEVYHMKVMNLVVRSKHEILWFYVVVNYAMAFTSLGVTAVGAVTMCLL